MGLTASGVRKRITRGRMHRVHRGVYAVGHPILSVKGRWLAAVLACGPEAALSHRDAAAHRGLLHVGARVRIDVLSPSGAGRGRPGIEVHRGPLPEQDRTVLDGIPVTSLARTLLDLAEVIDRRGLERALDRAEQLRLLDMNAIDDVLQGAHGRHGATWLEAVLATHTPGSTLTRSEFEERLLAFIDHHHLPRPQVNQWIALDDNTGYEADLLWPDKRLVVEADGLATHGTRRAAEHDRRRDLRLLNAGYRTIRVTSSQLTAELARAIRTALT